MPSVHFTPVAGLRDELGNEAGWYGRGWSCLQAAELMFCETLTYRAEGDSKSKPLSHSHRSGMTASAQNPQPFVKARDLHCEPSQLNIFINDKHQELCGACMANIHCRKQICGETLCTVQLYLICSIKLGKYSLGWQ